MKTAEPEKCNCGHIYPHHLSELDGGEWVEGSCMILHCDCQQFTPQQSVAEEADSEIEVKQKAMTEAINQSRYDWLSFDIGWNAAKAYYTAELARTAQQKEEKETK